MFCPWFVPVLLQHTSFFRPRPVSEKQPTIFRLVSVACPRPSKAISHRLSFCGSELSPVGEQKSVWINSIVSAARFFQYHEYGTCSEVTMCPQRNFTTGDCAVVARCHHLKCGIVPVFLADEQNNKNQSRRGGKIQHPVTGRNAQENRGGG